MCGRFTQASPGEVIAELFARLQGAQKVIVLDNLSTGFKEAVVAGAELVVGDTGDQALVAELLKKFQIDSVLHFAAHTIVPESVSDPLKYYGNNTCCTRNLLACCQAAGVKHFICSSTAAVYGIPDGPMATEDTPNAPINPYGTSKLMSEWMLARSIGRDRSAACRATLFQRRRVQPA